MLHISQLFYEQKPTVMSKQINIIISYKEIDDFKYLMKVYCT